MEQTEKQIPSPKTGDAPESPKLQFGDSHLEMALYELQHALICYSEAFYRYVGIQLARIVDDPNMTGSDCVILHSIRAGNRPKTLPEIQHYTNRNDLANIQYSIKKLTKAGLINKVGVKKSRHFRYDLTDKGQKIIERYIFARKEFIELIPRNTQEFLEDINDSRKLVLLLTGYYDNASRALTVE